MTAMTVMRASQLADASQYREAVARTIEDIRRDHRDRDGKWLTYLDIAEAIDVSLGTVAKAARQESDLCATFLLRLGQVYGAGYLNACLNLTGAQAAPLDGTLTSDILPMVMAVAHKISCARDPEGPGGVTEVPQEKRGYLPDLKRLNQRSGCLIQEIEAAI